MILSPDFSLFSLVRPKYFLHTRLVWLLLTFTFSPDQSGKTPILPPHQTSLVRRWRLIVTRPVWCSLTRLHPMPSDFLLLTFRQQEEHEVCFWHIHLPLNMSQYTMGGCSESLRRNENLACLSNMLKLDNQT